MYIYSGIGISHHFEFLTLWSGSNENGVQFYKRSSHLRCFYNILQGTTLLCWKYWRLLLQLFDLSAQWKSTGPLVNMTRVWPIKMSGRLILCLYRPVKICWQCTQVVWCKSTIKQDKFKCPFTEKLKSKLTSNLNKVYVMRPDRVGEGVFCSIGLEGRGGEFEAKKPNLISKGKGAKK